MTKYVKSIKFSTSGETYVIRDAEQKDRLDTLEPAVNALDSGKQDKLTAGANITIENNVISATGGGTGAVDSVNGKTGVVVLNASDVHAATEAQGALADTAVQPAAIADMETQTHASGTYQPKLTSANAGNNVQITEESGVVKISATGGGSGSANWGSIGGTLSDQTDLKNALDAKISTGGLKTINSTSLEGSGDIELVTSTDLNNYYTKTEADDEFLTSSDVGTMAAEDKNDYYTKTAADAEFLSSSTADVVTDNNYSDIIIEDDNGNALVQFAEGHIKTKNFDSRDLSIPNLPFLDLSGKTVGFLGDSITYGVGASSTANRYSTLFCSIANCTERNLGVSGTCLAANTKNGKGDQRFLTRVTAANINGLDLLVIFGGSNDFSYDIKAVGNHFEEETITGNIYRGDKKRVANSDNETFSGALHELILAIRAINPALPMVYLTPISRGVYNTTEPRGTSYETNANGDYLSDFTDAIKDICAFYSIPVFYTVDHFPYDLAQDVKNAIVTGLSTDAIHPNDRGHAILAQTLYKWIITNISI